MKSGLGPSAASATSWWRGRTSAKPADHEDPEYACDGVPFTVDVECGGRCSWELAGSKRRVEITPLAPGKLTLDVTLRREQGDTFHEAFVVNVVVPEELFFECLDGRRRCEDVDANRPLIIPMLRYKGTTAMLRVGTANSKPVRAKGRYVEDFALSLADLDPTARTPNGVVAKRYAVVLASGSLATTIVITARAPIRRGP